MGSGKWKGPILRLAIANSSLRSARVCGEEDDQADLRQLSRLKTVRAKPEPQPCAVDRRPQRRKRQQQENDSRKAQDVLVASKNSVVPEEDQSPGEAQQTDRRPNHLSGTVTTRLGIQPIHGRKPDEVETCDQREHEWVRLARNLANENVHADITHRYCRDEWCCDSQSVVDVARHAPRVPSRHYRPRVRLSRE